MRLVPIICSDRTNPRNWLLATVGIAWGQREDDQPRGRIGLWLWRRNVLHHRTRDGATITDHWRFLEYGLELEVNNRRRYIKLA